MEDRTLLSYLFVDFGDNFPGGTLTTTQGAFQDVANDPTPANRILGTTLLDGAGGFNAGTRLDIVAQTFTATQRTQMMDVVERAYAPLNVTVVELTATSQTTADGRNVAGAVSMADVINTLRTGTAALRDAYVFVATFIVDMGGANPQTYGPNGGGLSPGDPDGSGPATGTTLDTNDLAAASNVHDDVAVVYSTGGFNNNTLNNIAHEAGHLFGLRHAITNPVATVATNLFHQAEIMSYRNTNNTTSSMFTRYPMIRGDGNSPQYAGTATFNAAARTITRPMNSPNFDSAGFVAGMSIVVTGTANNNGTYVVQSVSPSMLTLTMTATLMNETANNTTISSLNTVNYNDLAARTGDVTTYDQLRTDANVLANPNFTFVSGTGAHDIITITRNGAMADVTVQAFADAAYSMPITVPGEGDTTYSYSIPLTTAILIYGGDSNDRFVIDAALGVGITIDGMLGTDRLVVNGGGAASATYTPNTTAPLGVDLNTSFGGALTIGSTTISFLDFETSGRVDVDNVMTVTVVGSAGADSLTADRSSGATRVMGTVNGGTGVVPLFLTNITTLNVNTVGGGDTVTVSATGGNPIPTGGIGVDGGANTDTLVVQGATATYTPDPAFPNDPSRGSLSLGGPTIRFMNFEFVRPVAPDITGLSISATNINEGDTVTLSGTFIDPGSLSSHTLTIRWGDGTTDTIQPLTVGDRSFSVMHQYRDDNPTATASDLNTIQVTITDNDALTDMQSTSITVNNLDPVITSFASDATFEDKAEEGEPVNILATFTDVGVEDTHTAVVDWGDGSAPEMVSVIQGAGFGSVTGSHAYAAGGIYTIVLTLTDDDTGSVQMQTTAVVSGVGLNNGVLFIIGTNEGDDVSVNTTRGHRVIRVHASFTEENFRDFDMNAVDKIIAYLCDGDDQLVISSTVVAPAIVHGGRDNDHLHGGGGPTVLIGDSGDDTLIGQSGGNILIGGVGADRLVGGMASDILIGGNTSEDGDDMALMAAMSKWSDAGMSYEDRVAAIISMLHVNDDGDQDNLTGSAGLDLFWLGLTDRSLDKKPGEIAVA